MDPEHWVKTVQKWPIANCLLPLDWCRPSVAAPAGPWPGPSSQRPTCPPLHNRHLQLIDTLFQICCLLRWKFKKDRHYWWTHRSRGRAGRRLRSVVRPPGRGRAAVYRGYAWRPAGTSRPASLINILNKINTEHPLKKWHEITDEERISTLYQYK